MLKHVKTDFLIFLFVCTLAILANHVCLWAPCGGQVDTLSPGLEAFGRTECGTSLLHSAVGVST